MKAYRSFGLFGLIILAFGIIGGLTSGWTTRYTLVHVIGGLALLALYLFTHVENLRESVAGRKARHGTNTVVYTLLTLGVLVMVNYLVVQNEFRYDATEQGIFSIAPQTRQALDGLETDIEVFAFFRPEEGVQAEQLLESYAAASDRLSFEMVDPDESPQMAEEMEITQYGTLVITDGTERTRITEVTEQALTNAMIRFTAARENLVYYVTGHGEPDLETAQAPDGFSAFVSSLENEGNRVEELLLAAVPDVPADADLLVVAAPQRAYLDGEVEVLSRYLDRGGKALFLLDPRADGGLGPVLEARGIELGDDVLVDQVMQLFSGPQLGVEPIVADYGSHPITQDFAQRTIFTLARSVSAADELPEGVTVTPLARTSANSWAESDVERLFGANEAGLDEEDTAGPVAVGVAATLGPPALSWTEPRIDTLPETATEEETTDEASGDATAGGETGDDAAGDAGDASSSGGSDEEGSGDGTPGETGGGGETGAAGDQETAAADAADGGETTPPDDLEGRLVVFGDSDWVRNEKLTVLYNEDLLLNTVGWLAGQEELISIRPRQRRASRVTLTTGEQWAVFHLTVLLLPEIVLLAGLAIWWRRRR